jgi:hypothetical protein
MSSVTPDVAAAAAANVLLCPVYVSCQVSHLTSLLLLLLLLSQMFGEGKHPHMSVTSPVSHLTSLLLLLQMFGEGKHPHIERLFETRLAPFLSQKAFNFWSTRLWYFKQGLYYQGGMVSTCYAS